MLFRSANVQDRSNVDGAGNPRYSMAFKENPAGVPVLVKSVEWGKSRFGRLTPVITFDPIWLDATVSRATASNAKIVREKGIGPDSSVLIVRSGGVIPKIKAVTCGTEPVMPTCPYVWDERETFVYMDPASMEADTEVQALKLRYFLQALSVKHIGTKMLDRLVAARRIRSLAGLIQAKSSDLTGVRDMGPKRAKLLCTGIRQALSRCTLTEFAVATSLLGEGIGCRKLQLIVAAKLEELAKGEVPVITDIAGIGDSIGAQFRAAWPVFWEFWQTNVPPDARGVIMDNTRRALHAHPEPDEAVDKLGAAWVLQTGGRDKGITAWLGPTRAAKTWSKKVTLVVIPKIGRAHV